MTAEIGRMNVTRNYLHQNISELDKIIVDFEYEQTRMMAKKDTIMAELAEKAFQLQEKRERNNQEQAKLDQLKEKLGR